MASAAVATLFIWQAAYSKGRLPSRFEPIERTAQDATRGWRIADIVEIRRIVDVAVSFEGTEIAFVLKQSFLESGDTSYGLYVAAPTKPGYARKVLESQFLDDLAWDAKRTVWTLRGEFGAGVQLYAVDSSGNPEPLVINANTAVAGNWEGVVGGLDSPQNVGVLSYEWAPDGSAFWYSALRLRSAEDLKKFSEQGIVFDDKTMNAQLMRSYPGLLEGTELHVVNVADKTDRVVAFAPSNVAVNMSVFRHQTGTAWESDSRHVGYSLMSAKSDGTWELQAYLVDVKLGESVKVAGSPDGARTHLPIAEGQQSPLGDTLSQCSFDRLRVIGACVRESLTRAPELVSISGPNRKARTIVRPNAAYDAIEPLRSEYRHWTNRYGSVSDGYITYPRNYMLGRKYPVILVTHGNDARSRFADPSFQWEFPVQVLAERGYFVLSVNEPQGSLSKRASLQEKSKEAIASGISDTQFNMGLDAVATMESALKSLNDAGLADVEKTGIAGYSRGGEVVEYTMTQSKMFKVASIGDGGSSADSYWRFGTQLGAVWAKSIYGGSPYDSDPGVIDHYRRFSPSFRAGSFAGPLLQQFPIETAGVSLELNRLLKDRNIPVELIVFPHEAHIFWHPRHRAAAMECNVDWFDYWLLDKRNDYQGKKPQYDRWQSLADEWSARQK